MNTTTSDPPEQFGPTYPALGTGVQKYRRLAKRGLATMTPDDRRAYGQAVHAAIQAMQRRELQRELPSFRSNCASGTAYSRGKDIHAAIRRQQASELESYAGKVRRERTPEKWRKLYSEAMAARDRARHAVHLDLIAAE